MRRGLQESPGKREGRQFRRRGRERAAERQTRGGTGAGDEETEGTPQQKEGKREEGRGAPVPSLLAAGKPAERGRGRGKGPRATRGRREGRAGGDAPGWGRPV